MIYIRKISIALGFSLFLPNDLYALNCTIVIPLTWRWYSNEAYPVNSTTGWGVFPETYTNIIENKLSTFTNTDLNVGSGPNGKVRFLSANFGIGPDAWARVWSGSLECTSVKGNNHWEDNKYCFPGVYPADEGRITFNNSEMGSQNIGLNTLIALHEVGHIFGLRHMDQLCLNSFMVPSPQVGQSENLAPFEVNWINATY